MMHSEQIQKITSRQKLLNKLSETFGEGDNPPSCCLSSETDKQKYYALSSTQSRLFLLHEIDKGSTAYNLPVAFFIKGRLSIEHLEAAFQKVIAAQEMLRTSFGLQDGRPIQIVHPDFSFKIEEVEYPFPERDLEKLLRGFIQPFDLSTAPLIRVKIVKQAEREYVLFLDMHHIIADGRSMSILLEEVIACYQNRPLAPVAFLYGEYVGLQQERRASLESRVHKKYWIERFSGEIPKLDLLADYARSPAVGSNGAQLFFRFNEQLTRSLRELAIKEKVSLYILLMAIYQVFLHKYSQQEDLVVGSSVEGRGGSEERGVIGAFVNILPIRSCVAPTISFESFLREVRTTCLEAIEHQEYSFEGLVEELNLDREVGRNPLFDTFFDFHENRFNTLEFSEFHLQPIRIYNHSSKFDLSLEAINQENHIDFYFEYSTALFRENKIEKMKVYFEQIAKEIVAHPEELIANLEMVPEEEKRLLFVDFNSTTTTFSTDFKSFCEIFREQVQMRPAAIAAICGNDQISYEELDRQSSYLASHLISLGLHEEQIVAFMLERSISFLMSMLAVFKAGGAYVPIDPNFPEERILSLIEESRCLFILSDHKTKSYKVPSYVVLELLSKPITPLGVLENHPNSAAYVIFTSGSTGKPKGAVIEHKGMMNHLWLKIKDLGITSSDVVAQTSSQTFDVSVWQFLIALMVGGKVVIFPNEEAWDPRSLLTTLEKDRVTIFETVPSHMNLIIEEIDNAAATYTFSCLRFVMLNGEPLATALWEAWNSHYPLIPIVNAYGPTECSDDVCHYKIIDRIEQAQVPIGKILYNFGAYILDKTFSPVPLGLNGGMFIEGIGVGRGYLNDPVKTAAVFLPFPFDLPSKRGKRMYYTGDIVRYLPDGTIDYVGRSDFQVKIRGQRIELGEIETVLSYHEQILQIVVEVKENRVKERVLVAYLILKKSSKLEDVVIEDIRHYAKQKLPHHMVPTFFVVLSALPLLTNGKVNRKGLPAINLDISLSKQDFQEPKTEVQKALSDIWKDLLKISLAGINDNFFQLGGHSLLVFQLMSRIMQVFGIKLPLRSLFENPTIISLSSQIERELAHSTEKINLATMFPKVELEPSHLHEEFPLTDIQQAYWLGRSGLFSLSEVSVHVYTEYESTDLDVALLERSWNQVILQHDALRLVLTDQGTQKILQDTPYYPIQVIDLTSETEEVIEEKLLALREMHSHEVFVASCWPLFSIKAVKLKDKYNLLISFDSLILDGWSIDIVFRDWIYLYDHPKALLPPLELSFRDYVLAAKKLKETPLYGKDRDYWMKRVDHFPLAPQLPLVKSFNEIDSQQFSRVTSRFSKSQWDALQGTLAKENLSPTGLLSTVFAEVLHFYTNSNHFAINLTLFDRLPLHPQVNDIVGDFTSLTLLEVDYRSQDTAFISRLRNIQQQLWDDLDHQLFSGIEFLREVARRHKDVDSGSLYPVVFTSVLGLDNKQNKDLQRIFGKEVFSITQTPQVWLDFKAYEVDGDLVIEWDYVRDLFAEGFMQAMHTSFMELLFKLYAENSCWQQENLTFLPNNQLLCRQAYNNTDYPVQPLLLQEYFVKHAEKNPLHPAVITSEATLTYGDLYRMANQLGYYLRDQGSKPNQLVAIIMDKSWAQVVSCLGILQAGSAYLPLDSSLPLLRIEELLKETAVSFVLTQKHLRACLYSIDFIRELPEGHLISVDDALSPFIQCPSASLQPLQKVEDLAYVIFTSGSTGRPKGVMMDHRAVVNTILDLNNRYDIGASDRILAISSLSFDLSVYDIFGALSAGGTIVLPKENSTRDPGHWLELLVKERVTVWNSVPMFMQMFAEFLALAHQPIPSVLRLVLLSGDWIPVFLPQKIRELFLNDIRVVALGGATEAAIWSIIYEIDAGECFTKNIPYGRPLNNQKFYVLNDKMQMCPDWVTGGLYIGGLGLSRGYWGDTEKTQASFVEHPELGHLYKTGDLGRHGEGGLIEFLGRDDFQIKIGGYRIETQEIEAILLKHLGIEQAVVCLQGDHAERKQLVAYVVPSLSGARSDVVQLSDPQEVVQFKLEQKRRKKPPIVEKPILLERFTHQEELEAIYFSRKSYRTFQGASLSSRSILSWLEEGIKNSLFPLELTREGLSLDLTLLSRLLEPFASLTVEQQPWPKYRYPSGGALYPVRIYLKIGNQAVKGLEQGYYYYDPEDHGLRKMPSDHSENMISTSIEFYFVGQMDAIKPLYGDFSEELCFLEAGYMLQLLEESCRANGLSLLHSSQEEKCGFALDLPDDSLILRKATPSFTTTSISLPEVCVYIKNQTMLGREGGGWYVFNPSHSTFQFLMEGSPLQLSLTAQDSYAVYHEASFAVFFLHSLAKSSLHKDFLVSTGAISQKLMDSCVKHGIGMCPIGTIDEAAFQLVQKVSQQDCWVHGIFGGSVSPEQIGSKEPSKARPAAIGEALGQYLSLHLPKYMVPSLFMTLQSLPLSVNGKIERSLLPKVSSSLKRVEHVLPKNEWEHRLLNIWAEVLKVPGEQISIHDSFFELGGDSLMVIQVYNTLHPVSLKALTIDKLFHYPTIHELAQFLAQEAEKNLDGEQIALQAAKQRLNRLKKRQINSKDALL